MSGGRLSRLLAALLLLATAVLLVPAEPRRAGAQAAPALTLTPACGSGTSATQTVVRGTNFRPNYSVSVNFEGRRYDGAVSDSSGSFNFTLPISSRKAGSYPVSANQSEPDGEILVQASANYTVPCPRPPPPRITLTPACGNGASATTTRVFGQYFYPNYPAAVVFGGQRYNAPNTDAAGSFTFNLPVSPRKAGTFEVHALQNEPDGGIVAEARAPYTVPCPPAELTVSPICGDGKATRVRLTGTRFSPQYPVTIFQEGRRSAATTTDAAGAFTYDLAISARPPGVYTIAARQSGPAGDVMAEGSATYQVPCSGPSSSATTGTTGGGGGGTPGTTGGTGPRPTEEGVGTIVCVPPLGPPGFVTTVEGQGFPPGTLVTLRWAPGLGPAVRITANNSGAFRVPMLVLPREAPGLRLVVADSGTPPPNTPFLVVPGVIQPSGNPALPRFTR